MHGHDDADKKCADQDDERSSPVIAAHFTVTPRELMLFLNSASGDDRTGWRMHS
jgi:hypothetical protein